MGGSGDVVYMRGIAGAAADDDRDAGFQRALDENPGINVVFESQTDWDQAKGTQQFTDFLATGDNYDGIWTSGIDNVIVQAMLDADAELVPIVGADNAGFVEQLLEVDGLVGAAVTNSAAVGGAGVTLALQILNGEEPASRSRSPSRRSGRMTPRRASPSSRRPTIRTSIRPGRCSTPSRVDRLHEGSDRRLRGPGPDLLTNDTMTGAPARCRRPRPPSRHRERRR